MTDSPVALVTGAGRGIGEAIARRLASDGYAVVVNDVDEDAATAVAADIGSADAVAVPVVADVSDPDAVEQLVDETLERFGRVDALVNNAGIETVAPFLELDAEEWDRVLDTNLRGAFLLTQRVATEMVERDIEGAVVNITSIHQDVPRTEKNHYDASKAGLWMLTKDVALELAEHKINVNAVAPGAIQTSMNEDVWRSPEQLEEMNEDTPWGRIGDPGEVADAVAFLVSDEAEYVTGSYLRVDGGRSLTT